MRRGQDRHLHRGDRPPTWPLAERLCATCSAPPPTRCHRPPGSLLAAIGGLRRRATGSRLHPQGAAGRHRARRQPAEGPPGPPGRPRVRGRRPGRARPPPTSWSALSHCLRPDRPGRERRSAGSRGRSAGHRPVWSHRSTGPIPRSTAPSELRRSIGRNRPGRSDDEKPLSSREEPVVFCPIGRVCGRIHGTGQRSTTAS